MATPLMTPDVDVEETIDQEDPWLVFLGNDPVNTMGYVIRALRQVFGFSKEKASQLMIEAHQRGRTVVWSGDREQAETYASQLHAWQLWATVSQDKAGQ